MLIFIDIGNIRFYKYAEDTVHLLGYMGRIDKNTKIDELAFTDENFRLFYRGVDPGGENRITLTPNAALAGGFMISISMWNSNGLSSPIGQPYEIKQTGTQYFDFSSDVDPLTGL